MRLFIAIELPEETRQVIRLLQRAEAERRLGYRWTKPFQLHLTMKFLGEVDDARVESVWRALESLHPLKPCTLGFGWYRALPDADAPRVLALDITGDTDQLANVHAELEAAFEREGFPRDGRAFLPHVTVARRDPDLPLVFRGLYYQKSWAGLFIATELSLIQSRLKPSGAEYEPSPAFPSPIDHPFRTPNKFPIFPLAPQPIFPILPAQTLNRDGLAIPVEFSRGGRSCDRSAAPELPP